MKYIKYLGGKKPLDEVIDDDELTDTQVITTVMKFYEKSTRQITKERSKLYGEILKVKPKSITIEKVNKRWGSCSTSKEITYNYLLSTLPMELIDYIVLHELCHLYHMNHDRSFWRKVGSIIPDYKKRMERLNVKEL